MTVLFPVYTFHFLYSSCGCSSKGLPASEELPVSVSTTLKVTLQPSADALCIINIGYGNISLELEKKGEGKLEENYGKFKSSRQCRCVILIQGQLQSNSSVKSIDYKKETSWG